MTITERREALGSFQIDLKDSTPPDVLRRLRVQRGATDTKGYALVVVTPVRVDPNDFPPPGDPYLTPHPLLEVARWAGVLRSVTSRGHTLEGQGLESMLTDADEVGTWATQLTDRVLHAEATTLVAWLLAGGTLIDDDNDPVLFGESHLRVGDLATVTTEMRVSDLRDHRGLIRQISHLAGQNYRVRPTGHFDWGHPNDVFGAWPRVVIGRGLPAADDPRWPTLRATLDDWAETTDGYHRGCVADPPADWEGVAVGGALIEDSDTDVYYSPVKGLPVRHRRVLPVDNGEPSAQWRARAALFNVGAAINRWTASLSGEIVGDDLALIPGEPVWLWDSELGIEDENNTIVYAGQPIRPLRVPLISTTWAPAEGMGVYLLYADTSFGFVQRILDLTDHVDLATDRTVDVEVGAPAPTL